MSGELLKCPHCHAPLLDAPIGRIYVCHRCRRGVTEPMRWSLQAAIATTVPAPRDSGEVTTVTPGPFPPNHPPALVASQPPGTAIPFGWSDDEVLMVVYRHIGTNGVSYVQPDIPHRVVTVARECFKPHISPDESVLVVQCADCDHLPRLTLTRRRLYWRRSDVTGHFAWPEIAPEAVAVHSGTLRVGVALVAGLPEKIQSPLAELIRHLAALATGSP